MKKIICAVLTLMLCITAVACFAESEEIVNPFVKSEEPTYYICRPNVKCRSLENNEEFVTLHFGEVVTILERNGEYTDIEYGDGQTGYVTTGFIAETYYPMIYISLEDPVYLSYMPELSPSDYGFGACGQRWDERALILFEKDGYLFLVTEEGFCGLTRADVPGLSLYTGK